jgi:hypothetical protein
MTSTPHTPETGKDPVDRAEAIDEPERLEDPDFDPDLDKQPEVDPADAGLPSSPELDDDNTVVTPPNADGEPGSAAG